ncbi:uncharacterized protein LOC106164337 [Lingula anatina]|uniref:Uncharacterized protein LOC106164337 n=1 Tax=Lingula anatina TaxID=7574 RepID=A0A1S3IHH6_LINAN|nr:uncharacterized protein LOC106164337 [Lingula anatina]|eukprot:XP_013397667.1 uncharacterized protein LOC106164337 [Lingula anatina]
MVHLRSSRHRVFICHGGGYSVNGDCKVETWQSVKQKIVESLGNKDHIEEEIILNAKLQLVQTLRVSSPIKCMSMMPVTNGSIFIAHHTVGVDCQFSSFFSMRNNNSYTAYIARCKIPYEVTNIMFIPKYKKVIGFCTDNTLRVFDDCKYNCRELATTSCQHSVLSLIYNADTDEIVAGFRGGIMRWKIGGMKKLLKPLQPVG